MEKKPWIAWEFLGIHHFWEGNSPFWGRIPGGILGIFRTWEESTIIFLGELTRCSREKKHVQWE
jgi:hypothetical protein